VAKTYQSDWLYHSHVVKDSEFIAKITSDAQQSPKGKDPFFKIQLREDGSEYNLTPENAKCVAVMAGAPKHQWLRFTATGNRDGADLVLEPAMETSDPYTGNAPADYQAPYPTGYGGGEMSGTIPVVSVNPYNSLYDAYQDCLVVANDLRTWYMEVIGRDMDHVDQDLATSLYIQMHKDGFARPLQVADPDENASVDQLAKIEALLEGKELSVDDRDRAHALIQAGITRADADEWINRLIGLPNRVGDALPF
jgi:hypothetical protein